ncbi:alpha/beta hydrolase [Longimycelium tulufanense]|uniref:Alpha/beta hydrolase n=1 Tax=Longimycelium tulufanense TaxID=907463 RepID=A0A8J3FV95_9PSEU|nr:alpha/beta hydrolase [Longimycelium tulufanense]
MTGARFRTSDGAELHVTSTGPADAPVTVFLLHGWALTGDTWRRVTDELLAGAGGAVRVVRPDNRGHGRSRPTPRGSASIARVAEDLAELIEAEAPTGPVVLVGHSMGGMALMALAEQHPELFSRVAGVLLVNTSSGGLTGITLGLPGIVGRIVVAVERRVTRLIGRSRGSVLFRRSAPLRPLLRWLLFGERPGRYDLAEAAEQVASCQPSTYAEIRRAFDEHERRAALATFAGIPTVVFAGGQDRLTPPGHSRVIAAAIPGAELRICGGAGHMLPYERSRQLADELATMVRRAGSEAAGTTRKSTTKRRTGRRKAVAAGE